MKVTFNIAGVQFRPQDEIREAANELKVGDQLKLVPEPTNKFDPNAVKIIVEQQFLDRAVNCDRAFLGYVPKKFSSEVSGMLDIGIEIKCVVKEILPQGKTWEMLSVTISDEEDLNEDLCGGQES